MNLRIQTLSWATWTLCALLAVAAPGAAGRSMKHLAAQSHTKDAFYYLNHPESVRKPGLLADMPLRNGVKARIFFHYRNATGHQQQFWLRTTAPMHGVRWGWSIAHVPGHAGSAAAKAFFSRYPARFPRIIYLTGSLQKGMAVSGILEGTPTTSVRVLCRLGAGEPIGSSIVRVTQAIQWTLNLELSASRRYAAVRIGEKRRGHINGDYGATIRVHTRVPRPWRMDVAMSPRGGDIRFVYRHNGVVHMLPGCQAYKRYELYSIHIYASDTLEIIPVGGYCYPVELTYRLVKPLNAVAKASYAQRKSAGSCRWPPSPQIWGRQLPAKISKVWTSHNNKQDAAKEGS